MPLVAQLLSPATLPALRSLTLGGRCVDTRELLGLLRSLQGTGCQHLHLRLHLDALQILTVVYFVGVWLHRLSIVVGTSLPVFDLVELSRRLAPTVL